MKRTRSFLARRIAFLSSLLFAAGLSAQSFWLDQPDKAHVTLEYLRPDFKEEGWELKAFTAILSMRCPVGSRASLVAEIPYSYYYYHYSYSFYFFDEYVAYEDEDKETSVGNPYVGLEFGDKSRPVYGEVGLRLPLASDKKMGANTVGCYTDITRAEAFVTDMISASAMLNVRESVPSGLAYRLRFGPVLWFNTEGESGDDKVELWFNYNAQFGFETDRFLIRGSLMGRLWATQDELNFGERTFHQIVLSTALRVGKCWPGVFVVIPLDDDIKDFMSSVAGLSLSVQLGS
ncbi:MAG TPA: hypothetical protein VGB38_04735 [bacterium]